jgi:hypothetical protein
MGCSRKMAGARRRHSGELSGLRHDKNGSADSFGMKIDCWLNEANLKEKQRA